MENASKALLMAGGMILAILILSLLVYAWSLFSEYQSSSDKLADIEDTANFNKQFTNYDRDDVEGYELISLVNQIIDYNERKTIDTKNNNNFKASPIKITIDMANQADKFAYGDINVLIKSNTYTDEYSASNRIGGKSTFEYDIDNKIKAALTLPDNTKLDESKANKVAKNIDTIFLKFNDKDNRIQKYKRK